MQNKTFILSRTDSIGDVVLTIPMAGILKSFYPGCRIIFLGKKYTKPVIDCCEHVDEFADWDEIKSLPKKEQIRIFRSFKTDCIIHVFPNKEIALLANRADIPMKIGTNHRIFHWTTCDRLVNVGRKNSYLHEAQLNLKLLEPLKIVKIFTLWEIENYFGFTKVKPLSENLKSMLDENKFNLILHPKSKGSAREWGLENFSELIKILPTDQFKIFITGTKEEGEMMKNFLEENKNVTDLTGKLSLDELISFISNCNGLVAASTGPLHLAGALGKKAIGIYAPMRPIHAGRWAPLGKNSSYLSQNKTCNDCVKNFDCKCIREVSPEDVKRKLLA